MGQSEDTDTARSGAGSTSTPDGSFFRRGRRVETDEGLRGAWAELKPGAQLGHFELVRFLAQGGMGQVWEAQDLNLQRRVALKFILPERAGKRSLDFFTREARAGARLVHPNLVTTLACGEDRGLTWIAQELIDGSWTLNDLLEDLRASGEFPNGYYRRVARFIALVADGLQAAHEAGVVHRDVKPRNILIAPDDSPKLTDFGLARVQDDSFASQTGELLGTWAYMSPEQVTAKRMGLDHRTDVFSLGVVLYEMLALTRPFRGETTHQIAEQIIAHHPADPDRVRIDCPKGLARICSKALKKAPADRYQSMAELAVELRRWLDHQPVQAVRGVPWRWPLTSLRARALLVAALVVAATVVIAGVGSDPWLRAAETEAPVESLPGTPSGPSAPSSSAPRAAGAAAAFPEPVGDLETVMTFVGKPLPGEVFRTVDGEDLDLIKHRGRKVVLVIFRDSAGNRWRDAQTASMSKEGWMREFEQRNAVVEMVHPVEWIAVPEDPPQSASLNPATFILDEFGLVRYAYIGTEAKDRPPLDLLLEELDEIDDRGLTLRARGAWAKSQVIRQESMTPMGEIRRITLHHSVVTPANWSAPAVAETLRTVQEQHLSRGYVDIGFHYAIDGAGFVWECRSLEFMGAHAGGIQNNEGNVGIVLVGDFSSEDPTAAQVESLEQLVQVLRIRYGIPTSSVYLHSDFKNTRCPGPRLIESLERSGFLAKDRSVR